MITLFKSAKRYEQAIARKGNLHEKGILQKEMLNLRVMREMEFKTTLRYS